MVPPGRSGVQSNSGVEGQRLRLAPSLGSNISHFSQAVDRCLAGVVFEPPGVAVHPHTRESTREVVDTRTSLSHWASGSGELTAAVGSLVYAP